MAKPVPSKLHVNSFGVKKGLLQDIIHSEEGFYFLPLDSKQKTDIYNKGTLDGTKKPIQMYAQYEALPFGDHHSVLVVRSNEIELTNAMQFKGRISLDKLYVISVQEVDTFINSVCFECERYGESNCALQTNYFCAEEDRDRFRDSTWFSVQNEKRQQRKLRRESKRTAFPV